LCKLFLHQHTIIWFSKNVYCHRFLLGKFILDFTGLSLNVAFSVRSSLIIPVEDMMNLWLNLLQRIYIVILLLISGFHASCIFCVLEACSKKAGNLSVLSYIMSPAFSTW
jgi:hypothetical protein